MWSIGTIFVELVLRAPFLAGDSDIDQLKKTFHAMGSPTEEEWPVSQIDPPFVPGTPIGVAFRIAFNESYTDWKTQGHKDLPDYHEIGGYPKNPWWTLIASLGKEGVDLARSILRFDPTTRISAKEVSRVSSEFHGTI